MQTVAAVFLYTLGAVTGCRLANHRAQLSTNENPASLLGRPSGPAEPAVAIKVIVLLRGLIHQSNVGPTTAISGGLRREEKRRRKSRNRRRRRRRRKKKNLRTPGGED